MWLLALWISAAFFLTVLPNVEGVTCYFCKWEESGNGRNNEGSQTSEEPVTEIPGMVEEGRQGLPVDSTCKTSSPSKTVSCPKGCSWAVRSNAGSTSYYRGCNGKGEADGCNPIEGGKRCFCSGDLCNNGDGIGGAPPPRPPPPGSNYSSHMSDNKATISLGVLAVLFKCNA